MNFRALVDRIYFAMARTRRAFKDVAKTEDGARMLAAIREYCRPDDFPVVKGDTMETGVFIGRQEVWRMIERNLKGGLDEVDLRPIAEREALNMTRRERSTET